MRELVVVPHERTQSLAVSQGPLQRRYGVATLKLYTAGSRFTRTELPGLEYAEAVALRDRLLLRESAVPAFYERMRAAIVD